MLSTRATEDAARNDEAPPPVKARGLVKRYKEVLAVDHIDLNVQAGDVYGFLGPNGAGKTTTLRMALGLITPSDGVVELFGRDPMRDGARALEGVAGFVEAPRFYPYMTGRKNLELLAALDGDGATARIEEVLEVVELVPRGKHKVGGYSHGMRQRLGIAAALLRRPRLLILDEPATGLDPAGMRDMRALIRRLADEGITVLLSSHQLPEVQELCDRVAIVDRGKVVYEGALADLRRQGGAGYRLRTTDDSRALGASSARAPASSTSRPVRTGSPSKPRRAMSARSRLRSATPASASSRSPLSLPPSRICSSVLPRTMETNHRRRPRVERSRPPTPGGSAMRLQSSTPSRVRVASQTPMVPR